MTAAWLIVALQVQAPGDSITLPEALALARAHRAQAQAAAARVTAARAGIQTASAIPNPTISYSYTESAPTNHLTVDQPLEWVLRRNSDRAAARAGVSRAVADSALTMISLLRDVRTAFWRATAGQLSRVLVEDQATQADSLAHVAEARYRAGDISLLEWQQAAQEAARVHQDVSRAREDARLSSLDLAYAIGVDHAPIPVGRLDAGLDIQSGDSVDSQSLPSVRFAVADSAAAAAAARSASRARVPLPTIQAGAEWGDPGQPGALALVGVSLPLPLWQRGGGPAREADARAREAALVAGEARLGARRDLGQARIRLEEAAGRARVARDSLMPAASALRGRALRAYEAGETGIAPVLDALRSERGVLLDGIKDELAFQEAAAAWAALAGERE
jgi:outer membrane protein, heavy metal efflux system